MPTRRTATRRKDIGQEYSLAHWKGGIMTKSDGMRRALEAAKVAAGLAGGGYRGVKALTQFGDRVFRTRAEDFEAADRAENKRNRDIYYEMVTRRERRRRGL